MIDALVLTLQNIDKTKLSLAGGKGANLAELSRIEGNVYLMVFESRPKL